MKATPALRSSMMTPEQLPARLALVEEGSAPEALFDPDDGVGSTVVVGTSCASTSELTRRIEHCITAVRHSAQRIKEVRFLLAPSSGEDSCSRRLAILHAVMRYLAGSDVEVVLVLPSHPSTYHRNEIFVLAELLTSQLGASGGIRVRVVTNEPPQLREILVSPSEAGNSHTDAQQG